MPVSSLPIPSPVRPPAVQLSISCYEAAHIAQAELDDAPHPHHHHQSQPDALLVPQPAPGRKKTSTTNGKSRRRGGQQYNADWKTTMCNMTPFGACTRPQTYYSLFCEFPKTPITPRVGILYLIQRKHAFAVLVTDVVNAKGMALTGTDHRETGCETKVLDLLNRRKEENRIAQRRRSEVHAHATAYFDKCFGDITSTRRNSPPSYPSLPSPPSSSNTVVAPIADSRMRWGGGSSSSISSICSGPAISPPASIVGESRGGQVVGGKMGTRD
ncbi:hypothetical protein TREMEDRAFT_61227 [Tremella mesenterica DSM 1558]|uniref:uncharacterized protein n=1 Tax=Tremella mesenterica (strain ATCC 24925 / CBS 8224 / DSM 1558 / NBRC 9311 / NRRL Y-6157 / RJB 2259-6 / UBC 559-6) TaxID=578456 RepID=UPI0003F4A17A|nr:uncharacterized protein TREMEDRAFT_61227 [Tremella mesenterica DSM 1558]EIW70715.1 hypothetical protein TREMEDRAFT_61227 [Tremella mesenterica DSM 1558]